jgi:hypothetical protein
MNASQSRPQEPQDGSQISQFNLQVPQAEAPQSGSPATQGDQSAGMEFKAVLDFFGGSFFSEHYVGDLTKILERVELLETQAVERSASREQRAWAKLLRSIFHSLTGNLSKAYDGIEDLSRIEGLPPKWTLRAAAYQGLYGGLRRFPAAIRFKPELGGPTATFRNIEVRFAEMINSYQETMSAYLKTDLPLFRLEAQVLMFLIMPSLFLWNKAFIQHPSYPKGPWESKKANGKNGIAERMTLSKIFRDATVERGMTQLSNYLARLDVELEYGQSPVPAKWMIDLRSQYESSDDSHNLAMIKMLEADYILSPPFSNPIALNLIVYESSNPDFTIGPWDNLEGDLKIGDTHSAEKLYCEALDLFSLSASPRGQAAVLLR